MNFPYHPPPPTQTHTYRYTYTYTTIVNAISSSIYYISIVLIFNIVDGMKFIGIFSIRLCSFTIFNVESIFRTVLTISICCIKSPAKLSVIPLAKGWSVESRLRYSKSNTRIFKCIYATFFSKSLVLFGEKLFGGFTEWPILVTVNLHLLELNAN